MICTVNELREMVRGIGRTRLIEITESGITIVKLAPLERRTVKAVDVYTLLDSGLTANQTARRLGTSAQVVNHLRNQRASLLKRTEKNQ